MAKRKKPDEKIPRPDTTRRIVNALATANDRLSYWWAKLRPEWKPERTGTETMMVEGQPVFLPQMTTKEDGIRQYLVAEYGMTVDEVGRLSAAEVVELLRQDVERQAHPEPLDDLTETQRDVLEAIVGEMRGAAIAERSGYSYDAIRRHLSVLVRLKHIVKTKNGYRRVRSM